MIRLAFLPLPNPFRPSRRRARAPSRIGLAGLIGLGIAVMAYNAGAQGSNPAATRMDAAISLAGANLSPSALSHGALEALRAVYSSRANEPLWSSHSAITPQAHALLLVLEDAAAYGLEAKDYLSAIQGQLATLQGAGPADAAQWARFDASLSAAALHLISDLHFGRVSPEAAGFKLREQRAPFDLAAALKTVATATDVKIALAATEPPFYHYALLKQALAHYRQAARLPELTQLPPVPKHLKIGAAYDGSPALRSFLSAVGDLPANSPAAASALTYDRALSDAVRAFQVRHGLTQDGLLGKATLATLETPPARRIRQITLTLERWRWLTPFKTPPIIVNIPQFRLFAFRTTQDRVADIFQMDVIVGRTSPLAQTPVFEGNMRYVILRPYWDVPYNITRHEMLAKIEADPSYLSRERLEIASGPNDSSPAVPPTEENLAALAAGKLRLRQLPGDNNALGLVKFMFPNEYNVYLHSTPARELFKQSVRTFSHGCIRVSDPLSLATLVLKNASGDWTREKIDATMHGATTVRVNLERPVNVLILYGTALATEAGPVYFFNDIYGYDEKLERQLGLAPIR